MREDDATTLTEEDGRRPSAVLQEGLAVFVAACPDRPDLVGSLAFVDRPGLFLGRSQDAHEDLAPLRFVHVRPGRHDPTRPIDLGSISRVQLVVGPAEEGALAVRNLGKCALRVGGAEIDEARLRPERFLRLGHQMLLRVLRTPRHLPSLAHTSADFDAGSPDLDGLVGESAALWRVRDQLAFAAPLSDHVLIHGASGSGKELVARAIARRSGREGPFVARNAATIPESLMAAELFGNCRGYPNATTPEREGLIGAARGGTLFLDEIGELPHRLQAALLRLMDEAGSYQRLGESRVRRADVRVIGATNRGLDALKHDLRARFAITVEVPSLGERPEDVPRLIQHLTKEWGVTVGFDLVERLIADPPSSNVRELRSILLASRAAGRSVLEPPGSLPAPATDRALDEARIREALARHDGVVAQASRDLGLKNRYVLRRLLTRFDIDPNQYRR